MNQSRSLPLLGEEGLERLARARVAVFGLGGVGGAAAEALARAGVGYITLIDGDVFDESNLNRQLLATRATLGRQKAEVADKRVLVINPDCVVTPVAKFITPEDAAEFPYEDYDFIAECIDSLASKAAIIAGAFRAGTPVISSAGMGNRVRPEMITVKDVYSTSGDPLARRLRSMLRAAGVTSLPVVFSDETPLVKATPPASVSFVPPAAGMIMAGWIVRHIALQDEKPQQRENDC